MPELGATEDLTALIPGDPVVLRTAGETYRRYALMLEDASSGLGRVGTTEGWSGPAADGFRARVRSRASTLAGRRRSLR